MKIEGEHAFHGPRVAVWELVRDPNVLASCIPGAQNMEQVSESEYKGKMNVRVGPVAGVFSGQLVVSNEAPPESYDLSVQGRGAPGFVKGSGGVHLTEQGDGSTLMTYTGELQIGGKLAGVGQRLLDSVGKSIIRQGLASMDQQLQARLSPVPEPVADEPASPSVPAVSSPPPAQPSQMEFAATIAQDVAKDMAADLFAPDNQTAWIAIIATLLGVFIGFFLGRKCKVG